MNLAEPYADSKTFVDKPTALDAQQVISNFNALGPQSNITIGAIANFVAVDFVRVSEYVMPCVISD